MSDQDKKEAAEKASRAARQMKHAARNAGDATEAAADAAKDEVVDAAKSTKHSVQRLAQKAIYTEAGRGMLAIALAIVSGSVGVKKLQNARRINKTVRANLAKG